MSFKDRIVYMVSLSSYAIRAGAAVHFVNTNIWEFKSTGGESMLPTLNRHNDYVHVLKYKKRGHDVTMGDVIILMKPTDPDQRVCKRITGMPGDIILIDPSNNSLDNLRKPDTQSEPKDGSRPVMFDQYIVVPKGHVWVTGDNLPYSLDSRTYSALPMGLILGKIVAAQDLNDYWENIWHYRDIENNFIKITDDEIQKESKS